MKFFFTCIVLVATMAMHSQKPYFLIKSPEKPLPSVKRIAVLDFSEENHSYYDYEGHGKRMAEDLMQLWMQDKRGIARVSTGVFKSAEGETYQKGVSTAIFSFVERTEIERILKEQKLELSGLIDDSQAAQVGKLLGIDAMISGSTSWKESMENGTNRKVRQVRAAITMKVISVQTGEVLAIFSKDNTQQATQVRDPKTGTWGTLESASSLADKAFDVLALMAANYISPQFVQNKFKFRKIKVKEHADQAKKADDLMDSEDFEGAFTIYKTIVEADPYNAEALANTGAIYCIYGNFAKAVECYSQAAEIDREEYKADLDYAQSKLDELPTLASIGIVPPVNELQGNSHSATAKNLHTRGNKSERYEVYNLADNKSGVVTKVPGDTEFELLSVEGEWIKIKLIGGKQGYINKDNVKM